MMRYLFESQTINTETGEIVSSHTTEVTKINERFIMCRTTDSLSWLKEFTGRELQMLMVLNQIENIQTKTVTLTPLIRKEIMEFFQISKTSLSTILTGMEDKKFLLRLSQSDILLNPIYIYKGESSLV